jgi:hypothetical protein
VSGDNFGVYTNVYSDRDNDIVLFELSIVFSARIALECAPMFSFCSLFYSLLSRKVTYQNSLSLSLSQNRALEITYQQLVKTKNPLLVTTDLTFKILIALFAVVSMIIMKNYNKFSTPNLYAKSQFEVPHIIVPRYLLSEDGSASVQSLFLGDTKPIIEAHVQNATYCNDPSYINWRSPTYDGTYETVHYSTDEAACAASAECTTPIECITGGMTIGEMVKLTPSGLWVKTFLQEWTFSRQCDGCGGPDGYSPPPPNSPSPPPTPSPPPSPPSEGVPSPPPSPPPAEPSPPPFPSPPPTSMCADHFAFPDNCAYSLMGVRRGFTIAPENIFLPLELWYQDSLGNFNQPAKVFFNDVEYDGTAGALQGITLKDLLEAAGVDLDNYNDYLCVVGEDEANGGCAQGSTTGLTFRMTGIKLLVTVKWQSVHYLEPLNNDVWATLSVTFIPSKQMHSIGTDANYMDGGNPWHSNVMERTFNGVEIVYESGGTVGVFDIFTLMLAVTNAFVLIGMATTICDALGTATSEQFMDDKYEDDGERAGLEYMLEMIDDEQMPGLPFKVEDLKLRTDNDEPTETYERAIQTLQIQIANIENRLSVLPEDEGELRNLNTGHVDKIEYRKMKLSLIEDPQVMALKKQQEASSTPRSGSAKRRLSVTTEILLYPGNQTIGRGMAGVTGKAISRSQITLAVIREKVRVKSLRDGPGVFRSAVGRWESLPSEKAAVLVPGDRLCLRLREGRPGGHEGIFELQYQEELEEVDKNKSCTIFGFEVFNSPSGK